MSQIDQEGFGYSADWATPMAPALDPVLMAPPPPAVRTMPANPKQAYGDKKPPLHLVHMIAQLHESAALHSGKLKYGLDNYIQTPVEAMTYLGAIIRHTNQFISGERVDAKELVHHLGAVRACCNILLTAEATGMLIDNRPFVGLRMKQTESAPTALRVATANTFSEVENIVQHLNTLYPKPL